MRLLIVLFLISLATLGTPQARAENRLNLFTWSEYIDPAIIEDFEKRFDCEVVVDLYEDNESLLAKMETGGSSVYDVIVPSDYIIRALIAKNLLAELRHANIPNMKNIEDRFANPPYDRGNRFSVPYQWGTVGIYLRSSPDKVPAKSWSLFFDPQLQPGPFVLIDSARDAFAMALKYKGYSVNTTDKEKLLEARNLLAEAKKRALGFDGGVGGKNKVLAKTARMAVAFNGDAVRGMNEDPETLYFVPEEGSQIWIDNLAIPVGAPHRDLAETFVNFILEPEIGARLSDFNQYATPNKASLPLVKKDDRENPAIYPPDAIMQKLEFLEDVGDATKLFDELWTDVKNG